ncbi:VOC family protein [Gulosibacter macacae]|uniref:VOC family protein n=1 Tax=Gulosibacter macacae TaxID=2488791 RepID=A0A3P3VYU4_9MICO|nr:VOC family protein [Gulosibacter macacae]RRJ87880.1 VOC family protein [Gulosibacter macacae]
MQFITPNIWCQGNAEEVADFYVATFPNAQRTGGSNYPTEGLLDFQQDFAGKALTVDLAIDGYALTLINAGNEFRPTPAISFIVNFDPSAMTDAAGALDAIWARLSDGGEVRMPLQEYPFSKRYGWVEDRYGVNWQLMLTNPEGEPRPFLIPSLLFTGAELRAREAIERYTSLFRDSHLGNVLPYGEAGGAELAEGIMFSEFTLGGQWFTAMDGGSDHEFTFGEGLSLSVACADQAEIDRYWDALSHVPEAAVCGWCKDEFGVSWQIVPANMEELMAKPGAYEKMMQMSKIEIDAF